MIDPGLFYEYPPTFSQVISTKSSCCKSTKIWLVLVQFCSTHQSGSSSPLTLTDLILSSTEKKIFPALFILPFGTSLGSFSSHNTKDALVKSFPTSWFHIHWAWSTMLSCHLHFTFLHNVKSEFFPNVLVVSRISIFNHWLLDVFHFCLHNQFGPLLLLDSRC